MSKLQFVENGYSEDDTSVHNSDAHDSEEQDLEYETYMMQQEKKNDPYSLLEVPPSSADSEQSSKKVKKKKKKNKKSRDEVDLAQETAAGADQSSDDENEDKAANNSNKRRRTDIADLAESTYIKSAFLKKFLIQKREPQNAPLPPENEESNDSLLREFNSSFVALHPVGKSRANSNDSSDDTESSDSDGAVDQKSYSSAKKDVGTAHFLPAGSVGEVLVDEEEEEEAPPSSLMLQFFNLPYRVTEEKVCLILKV
jgi:hypothetical protein